MENATSPVSEFYGNDTALNRVIGPRFLSNDEIIVTADGVEQQINVDYEISGQWPDAILSCKIPYWSSDTVVRVRRKTVIDQQEDIEPNKPLPAENVEAALDKLTRIAQELDGATSDLEGRTLRVPEGQTISELPSFEDVTDKYLKIDGGDITLDDPDNFAAPAAASAQDANEAANRARDEADRSERGAEATWAVALGGRDFDSFAEGIAGTDVGDVFFVSVNGQFLFYKNGTSTDEGEVYFRMGAMFAAETPGDLLDSTTQFAEGEILQTATNHLYRVAASDAEDHHLETEGDIKLYVIPGPDDFYSAEAWDIPATGDVTAELQVFLDATEGKKAIIPAREGQYTAARIYPRGGVLVLGSGMEIETLGDGSAGGILIGRDNVTIIAYGAKITHKDEDVSHTLYLSRPKRCVVEGLEIDGPGLPDIHESDCIYVGGIPDDNIATEDFVLRNIKAYGARRNICSVTCAHRGLIEFCEFSDTVDGTFKKGIDLEGNSWFANGDYPVKGITIRKTYVHDTLSDNILCSWSYDTVIDDCLLEGAGDNGVNVTPSTKIGDESRNARVGDRLGVSAIDDTAGWITVSTSAGEKLIDDLGILPGYWLIMGTTGAGAYPAELGGYRCIEEISSDQTKIRVSENPGYDKITSTTGTGTGTLSNDPYTSELYITVFRDGNASKVVVRDTDILGPSENGIRISLGSKVDILRGEMSGLAANKSGVNSQYSRDVSVSYVRMFGENVARRGLTIARTSNFSSHRNQIHDFTEEGVNAAGVSNASMIDDIIQGCGADSGNDGSFMVSNTAAAKLSPRIHNGPNGSTRGLRLASTTRNCLVDGADCRDSGTDNATSIVDGGTDNRIVNSLVNDGSWYS